MSDDDEHRFVRLWRECAPRVLAYARRHVDPETAQDVVAETFLVAWRRAGRVPADPLPWLLVVARNTIANMRRSGLRQERLAGQLELVAAPAEPADVLATERADVLDRLAALTAREREALLLVAWDGLTAAQAAKVAGCSLPAFHVRLFRARKRLTEPVEVLDEAANRSMDRAREDQARAVRAVRGRAAPDPE
ncbi:RNA polymerase sigma factor [Actinoplanes bogorensis]|uniref:RNA polymerase sigma factor n=1 Tax=Paractinoplanes bogorensis TaxID=1610840 RepID=A0ABS5Z3B9_9ACTN|nr:RNA polymerase sigma factor [Actinoplanes bogorensis]MBU2668925.1 RNA polymerase sigma factor [Actinoplanes bogorensis]